MTRKSTLSPVSVAVISSLKEHGAHTAAALCLRIPQESLSQLQKRLRNLAALGWIESRPYGRGGKLWFLRPSARSIAVNNTGAAPPSEPAPAGDVAAPRRINVMAGTLGADPAPNYRPGAMQFMAIKSRGQRC